MARHMHASSAVELTGKDRHAPGAAQCGTCGRYWDDDAITAVTPVPAGRCPFEDDHEDPDEDGAQPLASLDFEPLSRLARFTGYGAPGTLDAIEAEPVPFSDAPALFVRGYTAGARVYTMYLPGRPL